MAKRAYKWVWTARIAPESLPPLQSLAATLGFIVETPGGFQGDPSPPAMLDALAAAYQRDPSAVKLAFKVLGITPSGTASYTSDPAAEEDSQ